MRILVIGVNGMLGHVVAREFCLAGHDTHATHRLSSGASLLEVEANLTLHAGVDVRRDDSIAAVVNRVHPDVIVNAAGVIKQRSTPADELLATNARFPFVLAGEAERVGATVIQISTDCVFSGTAAPYEDTRRPDPVDDYGRSKLLGELAAPHLTVRTSIVGRELAGAVGLLEWFLAELTPTSGYANARFSGVTAPVLARSIVALAEGGTTGLLHLPGPVISKLELLTLWADVFEHNRPITPAETPVIDRSLAPSDGVAGLAIPDWVAMSTELAAMSDWYSLARNRATET